MPTETEASVKNQILESIKKFVPDLYSTTTTETTTTTAATATGGYFTTTTGPSISAYSPITLYTTFTTDRYDELKEKVEKYTESTDRHVDQLEEDIEFLNKKREESEEAHKDILSYISDLVTKMGNAEKEIEALKNYTKFLETRIENLEILGEKK